MFVLVALRNAEPMTATMHRTIAHTFVLKPIEGGYHLMLTQKRRLHYDY
jgi:hypothetical protein